MLNTVAPRPCGTAQQTRSALGTLREAAASRLRRLECPASLLCVLSAAYVVLVNNSRMFGLLDERMDLGTVSGLAGFAAVFLGLTGMVAVSLLLVGGKYVLKPAVIVLLVLSAGLGYFTNACGVVFDLKMIENIAETFADRNTREAKEILSAPLALRLLLLGVLPSVLVGLTTIRWRSARREVLERSIYAGGMLVVFALLVLPNYRFMLFFGRENVRIKYYATPTHALNSLRKFVVAGLRREKPFAALGQDAVQNRKGRPRRVGIMVVGETARADHFSLNGYPRQTNPCLEQRRLLNYTRTTSSGTSTSFSVPCMFSFLTRRHFTPQKGASQSNVLDVLHQAGVRVVWIDNNSSDKGVCARIGSINLQHSPDPASPHYAHGGYYDEVLLEGLGSHLEGTDADVLIVLHTMGSHGPAYHRRYPPRFAKFRPFCGHDAPQHASIEEVVNAYDNTILYTDFVLDRMIAFLESIDGSCETFLYYVSDHGESLGENGVYLHGLPDVLAPAAQTHVPMLVWMSDRTAAVVAPDMALLQGRVDEPTSHDNVAHTLLGLFDVKTDLYRRELDLLRGK
ncbi:MAG: phosphoethanolamine transferase [Candidatus Brocadiae bacterium]|nr:phosphoethanolamine transferase [Candidatus Brocadiia bacterium]